MKRLNLGCGPKYLDGWINCDKFAECADVRADIISLPFGDGSIDEVIFYHTIEHVGRVEGLTALRELYRVIRPGGSVAIETPDRLKLIQLVRGKGPKSKGLNVVEGTRAAQGQYYPNSETSRGTLLDGVKGAMGGVSGTWAQKIEWHNWLKKRRNEILAALEANDMRLMPMPESVLPGEAHLYIWTAQELAAELESIGFASRIEDPQSHGQRTWRDCRVVGVKPCA